MSGSGFAMGLAIASYEWMAALTLIIVGVFFLPILLKEKIYTMPQFLERRYDNRVRVCLAVFWVFVYVLVNLTSVLYLGALAIETLMGIPLLYAVFGLVGFAMVYSLYGGLKAVAWTDVVQVVFLVGGGLVTTVVALELIDPNSIFGALNKLYNGAASHFHMIFEPGQMLIPDGQGGVRDAYMDLPGISVLIGGMWIANLYYWGCNQYITQRALAAKSLDEAQKGIVFAAFLKLILPIIVVLPGIAAYMLIQQEGGAGPLTSAMTDATTGLVKADKAYPTLLSLLPVGLKGLAFAALTAAIASSLASMANSTATIFTMDLYKPLVNKNASETHLVTVGRVTAAAAFIIAALVAPALGTLDQVFQYIQEYTGFVSPGVLVIFLLGFFWKKATANAALLAAILTIPCSALFKFLTPGIPFLNRMGLAFLILLALMVVVSWFENKGSDSPKAIIYDKGLFKTSPAFNAGALGVMLILTALYTIFW